MQKHYSMATPDYNKVYNSLIADKTPDEITTIKDTFKNKYDFDPDAPVEKLSPPQENVADAAAEVNPSVNGQSSGDSSDTKDDLPVGTTRIAEKFDRGIATKGQKKAYDAYRNKDPKWYELLEKDLSFDGLQDSVNTAASKKFEAEVGTKEAEINAKVQDEAGAAYRDSPKVKIAVDTFVEGLDIDAKQRELIKKYDVGNDPEAVDLANEELNKWVNDQVLDFVGSSETLNKIEKDIYSGVAEKYGTDYQDIESQKSEFYKGIHGEIGATRGLIGGQQKEGFHQSGQVFYNAKVAAVKEAEPGSKEYDFAVSNRNIAAADLVERKNDLEGFRHAEQFEAHGVEFYKEDGFLGINWDKVWNNKTAVFDEIKKQLPQSGIALLQSNKGGPFGLVSSIPSRIFFWAQMHSEYLNNGVENILNDQYGQGQWGDQEYLDFVGSGKFNELRNTSLVSSSITSQFDRWSDKFGLTSFGGPKLKFAFKNTVERLAKNSLSKTAVKLTQTAAKIGSSAWVEGQTEVLQETIGEGVSDVVRTDWNTNILEATKNWYVDKDKLTEEQRSKFGEAQALGTLIGAGFGGAGSVAKGAGKITGKIFGIDILKDKTLAQQFTVNPGKFSFLDHKAFNENIDKAIEPQSKIYNDPKIDPALRQGAFTKLIKLLDSKKAYNEADSFNLNRKGKVKAVSLLSKRADLQRKVDLAANNGLAANFKEEIKGIDEQLQRIQTNDKQSNQQTTFERIRKIVGPKRSVGAARKSNLPQRVVDSIGDIIQSGADKVSVLSRFEDSISDIKLNPEQIAELKDIVDTQFDKFASSGVQSFSEFLSTEEAVQDLSLEGTSKEELSKFKERTAAAPSTEVPTTVDDKINTLINASENTSKIVGGALETQARIAKYQEFSDKFFKNQEWEEPRVREGAKKASSAINSLKRAGAEEKAGIVEVLQEFINAKDFLNNIVIEHVNKNVSYGNGVGQWTRWLEEAKTLEQTFETLSGKELKTAKAQLKILKNSIKNAYTLSLLEVQQVVAEKGGQTNQYPKGFDTLSNSFVLKFDNKLGTSTVYDLFPDKGQAIFEAMDVGEWTDLMILVNRYQNKTGDARAKFKSKAKEKADKLHNKYKDTDLTKANQIKIDAAGERAWASKALKNIKTLTYIQDEKAVVEGPAEYVKPIEYSTAEEENAVNKLEIIFKDPKSKYETELLYAVLVDKTAESDAHLQGLMSSYVNVVGQAQADAFIRNAQNANFEVDPNAHPAIARVLLMQQLLVDTAVEQKTDANISGFLNDILDNSVKQERAALKQRIAEVGGIIDGLETGLEKQNARELLGSLSSELYSLDSNEIISKTIPNVSKAPRLDGSMDVNANNIIAVAGELVLDDTATVPEALDLGDTVGKITKEELANALNIFSNSTIKLNDISEEQARNSAKIRAIGFASQEGEILSGKAKAKIESLSESNEQLKNSKLRHRENQIVTGKLIVGVKTGEIKAEGFDNSFKNLNKTAGTVEIGTVNNKAYLKELATINAKIADINKKLDAIEDQENNVTAQKLLHKKSMLGFQGEGLKFLTELDISKYGDLNSNVAQASFQLTVKEQNKLDAVERNAEEEHKKYGRWLQTSIVNIAPTSKAIGLKELTIQDLSDGIAYGLETLLEDGDYPTIQSFIVKAGSILPLPFADNTTEADKGKARAYAGAHLYQVLQDRGILTWEEGDNGTSVVQIADIDSANNFVVGNSKAAAPSAVKLERIKIDKKAWNQVTYTKRTDWNSSEHISGQKAHTKAPEGETGYAANSNALKILNRAKNIPLSIRKEGVNTAKLMLAIGHPAFDFTNKAYTAKQKSAKARELNSILVKADGIGERDYYSMFKFGSRGRLYNSTSYLNFQAAKQAKALIQFGGKPKPISADGISFLLSGIAELAGEETENGTLEEMAAVAAAKMPEYIKRVSNPAKHADSIYGDENGQGGTDEPALFESAVREMMKAMNHGDPATYPSNYIDYIDGSVNGIQMLGSVLKYEEALKWTNLVPSRAKKDLYTKIFNNVAERLFVLDRTEDDLKFYGDVHSTLQDFDTRIQDSRNENYEGYNKLKEQAESENRELTKEEISDYWDGTRNEVLPGDTIGSVQRYDAAKQSAEKKQGPELAKETYYDTYEEYKENTEKSERRFPPREVSEASFLNAQKNLYKNSIDFERYNKIFWGQEYWLERGRKAGKKPVMTTTYNAHVSSMADGLYKEFSVDKTADGKPVEITEGNTYWLASELKAELESFLDPITVLKKKLQTIAEGMALGAYGEDNKNFGWTGKWSGVRWNREYKNPVFARIPIKNGPTLKVAVGDEAELTLYERDDPTKKTDAFKKIISAVVANFTHSLDKEVVAWLYLNYGEDLVTIHDSYGARLSDMMSLFDKVREGHEEIFSGDLLYEILEENIGDVAAREITDELMVNDANIADTKDNQHGYGKSSKADKDKAVTGLYDRAGVDRKTINKEDASFPDATGQDSVVTYKKGSLAIVPSEGYMESMKTITTKQIADINLVKSTNLMMNDIQRLSANLAKKKNGQNIISETEVSNLMITVNNFNNDISSGKELSLTEVEDYVAEVESGITDYKKVVRGSDNPAVNTLATNLSSAYQLQLVAALKREGKLDLSYGDSLVKQLQSEEATEPEFSDETATDLPLSGSIDSTIVDDRTCTT